MPTTCAYYLYKEDVNDEDECFVQYFMESGLGCAVRLQSHYYSHFYAYAFDHHTSVPLVIRDKKVVFANSGFNMIAWGPSKILTTRRVAVARRLGIIQPQQDGRSLTQRRITEFFGMPANVNHPERFLFGVGLQELDVSVANRNALAVQLGIIRNGQQLNMQVIGNWFENNLQHPQRYIFGCDVEEQEYRRMIGTALGFIQNGQNYEAHLAAAFFARNPRHQDRYIFNV